MMIAAPYEGYKRPNRTVWAITECSISQADECSQYALSLTFASGYKT